MFQFNLFLKALALMPKQVSLCQNITQITTCRLNTNLQDTQTDIRMETLKSNQKMILNRSA